MHLYIRTPLFAEIAQTSTPEKVKAGYVVYPAGSKTYWSCLSYFLVNMGRTVDISNAPRHPKSEQTNNPAAATPIHSGAPTTNTTVATPKNVTAKTNRLTDSVSEMETILSRRDVDMATTFENSRDHRKWGCFAEQPLLSRMPSTRYRKSSRCK